MMGSKDDPFRHHRLLLQAALVAHPVLYQDKQRYIQVIRFDIASGFDVYLTGDSAPHAPEELQIAPTIESPAPAAPEGSDDGNHR